MADQSPILFKERLRRALTFDLDYPERTRLPGTRPAAVLSLWGYARGASSPSVLVIKRAETLTSHQGQMAFPGGMRDEGEALDATALRETEEEVGISRHRIEVLGELPALHTVTSIQVTPFVGWLGAPIDQTELRIDPRETEAAFWVSLMELQAQGAYSLEQRDFQGARYPLHAYQIGDRRIWGATGAMLKNLLDRIERADP